MDPPPHVTLTYEGLVPVDLLETFERAIACDGLDLKREARVTPRLSASMALLLPTGVGLFLNKGYFDAFLTDLDAAHLPVLEAATRRLAHRLAGLALVRPPPGEAQPYLPGLSIWTDRDPDSRFKMLFATAMSPEGLDAAIGAYLTFAQAYHGGALEREDLEVLAGARPLAGVVLLAYDTESATIQPVDPFEGRGL